MPTLIVVQGPTASGKSTVAARLAARYGAPVLSCDSRQFYREMSIGTAVPTQEERAAAVHYFVQDRSVETPLSAGGYEVEALARLEQLFQQNEVAVLVGGSGLYVDALLYGLDPLPSSAEVRAQLRAIYEREGLEPILEALKMADPMHYARVDRSNPARVLRALEVCRTSGMPYSNLRTGRRAERPFKVVKLATDLPREALYERINQRVDQMIEQGLEQEARSVIQYRDLSPLKTVGYSEWFDCFDGNISPAQAVEKIKQNSRNYAKRQLTWLRRETDLPRFSPMDFEAIATYVDAHL